MRVTSIVLFAMLAAVFISTGLSKVTRRPRMTEAAGQLGYSVHAFQAIGAIEIAAAGALIGGTAWVPLGVLAAAGLVALLVGAVIAHRRVGHGIASVAPPAWLAAVSVAAVITGIASL